MKRYPLHWTRKLYTRAKVIKALQSILHSHTTKAVIITYTLSKAERHARREFRIAHPARFACSLCEAALPSQEALTLHTKESCPTSPGTSQTSSGTSPGTLSPELRAKLDVFYGSELGRRLQAKRLMFSTELGSFEWRVDATRLSNYRPRIAEEVHLNIKHRDVRLVMHDTDPQGIYKRQRSSTTYALEQQFRSRFTKSPYFEDTLFELAAQCGNAVDVVVSPQSSAHAEVKFVWRGFAEKSIQIIGIYLSYNKEILNSNHYLIII